MRSNRQCDIAFSTILLFFYFHMVNSSVFEYMANRNKIIGFPTAFDTNLLSYVHFVLHILQFKRILKHLQRIINIKM